MSQRLIAASLLAALYITQIQTIVSR